MTKIFMPSPGEDWIGDIQTVEFKSFSGLDFVDDPNQADVIYLFSKWIWNRFPIDVLEQKPVVTTIHHIVPEKGLDIDAFERFTDAYHVPNIHTERQLRALTEKPIVRIPYWSNPERWKPQKTKPIAPSYKVLASFQRDTEGGSTSPKLEKGPDIFASIVESFKSGDVLPFIPGWRRDYIRDRLKGAYNVISSEAKLPHSVMNGLYDSVRESKGYYLITSRHEGGPMAVIECALMGAKVLSTDMGMASEVLHPDCIVCAPDDPDIVRKFHDAIEKDVCRQEQLDFNLHRALELSPDKHMPKFVEMLEGLR